MPAGMDVQTTIFRMNQEADDDVGGAVLTGTAVYECVATTFQEVPPSLLLLQQGLETKKIGRAMVRPATMIILERDELLITAPSYHPYLETRWRIIRVNYPQMSVSQKIALIQLTLERYQTNRSVQ